MLRVSDLAKRFADRLLFDRVSFVLNPGERLGLVGPNGIGKTTLLRIVAGEERPDAASVWVEPKATIGYLRQGATDLAGGSLGDLIDGPAGGLLAARSEFERATAALVEPAGDPDAALAAYDAAFAAFENRGGWAAVEELGVLLAALGLSDVPFETPLAALSGGQKTRAGLAALLARGPDLLLLDEPTNHLDGDALTWLEGFVRAYRGGVLIVSHDRAFLDAVATGILALDAERDRPAHLTASPGGYSEYLAARAAAEAARLDAYERQQRTIARIEADIRAVAGHALATERATQHDFYRARAKKVARTAKVRERKLERLLDSAERVDKLQRRWTLAPDFGQPGETGRDVAILRGVGVAPGGRPVLRGVDLHLRAGERVALTGPNGGGKTTLLRVIAGELAPDRGAVRLGAGVVVGHFTQEQQAIDPDCSPLQITRALAPLSETEARTFLHRYLFGGEAVHRPARDLSYGERARLALALLELRGANLLLLDEPLNHLDLPAREEFEDALTGYAGTVLAVLHDRYAIRRLATRVLELRDGRLIELDVMPDPGRSGAGAES